MISSDLTASSSSGLCVVARSEAGTFPTNPEDTQALLHNSHWLPSEPSDQSGLPSRHVAYYDAASLYPSSGMYSSSSLPQKYRIS